MTRLMRSPLAGSLALLLCAAAPAAAQSPKPAKPAAPKPAPEPAPAPAPEPAADPAGDKVELGDDGAAAPLDFDDDAPGAPGGSEENPGAPREWASQQSAVEKAARIEPTGYPIELARRPITLEGGMSEVAFDLPVNVDPFLAGGVLRPSYGITDDVQLGLRYGTGSIDQDGDYHAGKAAAIDLVYRFIPNVAGQLSVTMFFADPFAMSLTLGAPVKLEVTDRLALFAGSDLVTFKLAKFAPRVDDAVANEAAVAALGSNSILPDGDITVQGGLIYQFRPNLAAVGTFGVTAVDFSSSDTVVPLRFSLTYSTSNKLDVGGRLGFASLDDAGDSFGLAGFVAVRI